MFLGDTPEVVLREGIVGWKFMYNSIIVLEYVMIIEDTIWFKVVISCVLSFE